MLLNLTNHPSSKWGKDQLQKAIELYGKVEDIPFPSINPLSSTEEIKILAEEYCNKIIKQKPKAVHLMGEMTFTHALVTLLQQEGIDCVASTSERKVIEEENGKKTVLFEFKQFRTYPNL
jgi:hypothetical protein